MASRPSAPGGDSWAYRRNWSPIGPSRQRQRAHCRTAAGAALEFDTQSYGTVRLIRTLLVKFARAINAHCSHS